MGVAATLPRPVMSGMIGIQVDHRDPLEPGGIARNWIPYARLTL
jgi:hypothetical protein